MVYSRYLFGCAEENLKILCQCKQSTNRDLNPWPPESDAAVLPTWWHSMPFTWFQQSIQRRWNEDGNSRDSHNFTLMECERRSNGLSLVRVRIATGRRRADPHVVTNGSRGTWKCDIYMNGCLRNSIIITQSHALVCEYRQSRVQLCVREVVPCVCDVTVGDGVQLWHDICVQT